MSWKKKNDEEVLKKKTNITQLKKQVQLKEARKA